MNLQEQIAANKKLAKSVRVDSKDVAMFLNSVGVIADPLQVGDKIKFPTEISVNAGTLSTNSVNGNTFYVVTVEKENGEAINLSVNSLYRVFRDAETKSKTTPVDILDEADKANSIFPLFDGKTRAEGLQELQGKTVALKAKEAFESVTRQGQPMTVTVNAYTIVP